MEQAQYKIHLKAYSVIIYAAKKQLLSADIYQIQQAHDPMTCFTFGLFFKVILQNFQRLVVALSKIFSQIEVQTGCLDVILDVK